MSCRHCDVDHGSRGHDLWQITLDPQKGPELGSEVISSILCPTLLGPIPGLIFKLGEAVFVLTCGPSRIYHHVYLDPAPGKSLQKGENGCGKYEFGCLMEPPFQTTLGSSLDVLSIELFLQPPSVHLPV